MPKWLTVAELIKILVLVIALAGWGFSLENRVSLAEQAMTQETLGYRYLQNEMGKRLSDLAIRLDDRLARIEGLLMDEARNN